MKKIFLVVALIATAFVQQGFAQDSTKPSSLSQLLNSYYGIKNALINSDAKTAATKAGELVKAINGVDMKATIKNIFFIINDLMFE